MNSEMRVLVKDDGRTLLHCDSRTKHIMEQTNVRTAWTKEDLLLLAQAWQEHPHDSSVASERDAARYHAGTLHSKLIYTRPIALADADVPVSAMPPLVAIQKTVVSIRTSSSSELCRVVKKQLRTSLLRPKMTSESV